jgi:hypothetical protein
MKKLNLFFLAFVFLVGCQSKIKNMDVSGKWDLIDISSSISSVQEPSFITMVFELYQDNFNYIEFKNNKVILVSKDLLPFQIISYEVKKDILTVINHNNKKESYQIKQEKDGELILMGKGVYFKLIKKEENSNAEIQPQL